jgi:hypothetical protein
MLYWYKSTNSDAEGAHESTRCMVRRACAILMPSEEPGSASRFSKNTPKKILALLVQNCKLCTCTRYLHALLRGAPSVRDTDAARGVLWRKCEQVQYSN